MNQRVNFNKNVKMHEICAKEVISKYIDCICFQNGNAYATEGHLLICNRIEEICNFEPDQQASLEGKAISAESYKKILEYELATVTEDGFECTDEKKGKSFFYFYEPPQIDGEPKKEMPNFDQIFQAEKERIISSAERVVLNLDFLCKIKNALFGAMDNGCVITYYEDSVVVKPMNAFCSSWALLKQMKVIA